MKTLLEMDYTESEKLEMVKYLDYQNEMGNTALMIATKNALLDVVKKLHNFGANIFIQNKIGHTAGHIAAFNKPERTQ